MKAVLRTVRWAGIGLAAWLAGGVGVALAQGIYTCVDAKGRKLTSDRPIPECTDREQKELNASGSVRRSLGPTLTTLEANALEEKNRKAIQDQNRLNDEKRRERALSSRYPDRAAHDRVRAASLVQIAEVIRSASHQIEALGKQRKQIDVELEFYKSNPAKAPAALRRQAEENDANVAAQRGFIDDQEVEKNRVNARFDEELVRLTPMWQASVSATR